MFIPSGITMKTPKEKMSKEKMPKKKCRKPDVDEKNVERKKVERKKRRSYNMSKLLRCRYRPILHFFRITFLVFYTVKPP
jgi:hypothetical protein